MRGRLVIELTFLIVVVTVWVWPGKIEGQQAPFTPPSWFVREWGTTGIQQGQFNKPRCVACSPDGRVFIIDFSSRVQRFSPEGIYETEWMMPQIENGKPTGATVDGVGNLVVADTHNSRIMIYSPEGKLIRSWGELGSEPGKFSWPDDAAVDADGNFYVSEYNAQDRIQVFRPDGTFLRQWGKNGEALGEFRRAAALDVGPDGLVYVADSGNHRIQVFERDGTFVRSWGGQGKAPGKLMYPMGLACDAGSRIWVSEFQNNRVSVFDSTGRLLSIMGNDGTREGEFLTPRGIDVSTGGFGYVCDGYNNRVQVIAYRPGLGGP